MSDGVRPSWAILGLSWTILEASWAILAALVASQVRMGSHLGHLGRHEERQGGVMAAQRASGEGAMHAIGRVERGGGLRRLQKPCQTALGILARLDVSGGTVADNFEVLPKCVCSPGTHCGSTILYSSITSVGITIFVRVALGTLLERFGPVNVQSGLLLFGAIW
eukprot:4305337-Pyramimonas_sp.AAC.1